MVLVQTEHLEQADKMELYSVQLEQVVRVVQLEHLVLMVLEQMVLLVHLDKMELYSVHLEQVVRVE